jgi:hypothetical protein
VVLEAGVSVSSRSFAADVASGEPGFRSVAVPGIHGDMALYPFAFSWRRFRGAFSGLGFGATIDRPFWAYSTAKSDPSRRVPTSELRAEGTLRWDVAFTDRRPRPELLLRVGYGVHQFSLGKDADGTDLGPPDVDYRYVIASGGLRLRPAEWLALTAAFSYQALLGAGPIAAATEYGRSHNPIAFRATAGLEFLPYRGLQLGVSAYYEQFRVGFGDPAAQKPVLAAVDQFYGGILTAGYRL